MLPATGLNIFSERRFWDWAKRKKHPNDVSRDWTKNGFFPMSSDILGNLPSNSIIYDVSKTNIYIYIYIYNIASLAADRLPGLKCF